MEVFPLQHQICFGLLLRCLELQYQPCVPSPHSFAACVDGATVYKVGWSNRLHLYAYNKMSPLFPMDVFLPYQCCHLHCVHSLCLQWCLQGCFFPNSSIAVFEGPPLVQLLFIVMFGGPVLVQLFSFIEKCKTGRSQKHQQETGAQINPSCKVWMPGTYSSLTCRFADCLKRTLEPSKNT